MSQVFFEPFIARNFQAFFWKKVWNVGHKSGIFPKKNILSGIPGISVKSRAFRAFFEFHRRRPAAGGKSRALSRAFFDLIFGLKLGKCPVRHKCPTGQKCRPAPGSCLLVTENWYHRDNRERHCINFVIKITVKIKISRNIWEKIGDHQGDLQRRYQTWCRPFFLFLYAAQ